MEYEKTTNRPNNLQLPNRHRLSPQWPVCPWSNSDYQSGKPSFSHSSQWNSCSNPKSHSARDRLALCETAVLSILNSSLNHHLTTPTFKISSCIGLNAWLKPVSSLHFQKCPSEIRSNFRTSSYSLFMLHLLIPFWEAEQCTDKIIYLSN